MTKRLPPQLLWILIATAAFTVGNIYLSQPLLGHIATSFQRSPSEIGMIPALGQIGYVLGLIFIAPLGDVMAPKRLLIGLLGAAGVVLVASSLVSNFAVFCVLALAVGLSAVQAQIVLPFIATHSSSQDRGRNLGHFMSACLTGVLLSRTLSGYLGEHLTWKAVYLIWGLTMLALALLLRRMLPTSQSQNSLPYGQLVLSLWSITKERSALRAISLTGALMYGALSTFWASLAFYLGGPTFFLGTDAIGAFGLIGIAGALAANMVGRHLDKLTPRSLLLASLAVMLAAYLGMALAGASMLMLVASVVLLDLGAQAANICNQSEIYRTYADAQTRLNTIFKIFYFCGGAAGSALSAFAWQHFGWLGVCAVGMGFLTLAGWNVAHSKSYVRP